MNHYLLALALCFGANVASAQLVLGVKAGMDRTLTKVELGEQAPQGISAPQAEDGWGYHAGVFGEVNVFKKFFLRPEANYSVRAHSFSSMFQYSVLGFTTLVEGELNVRRTYIDVPILVGYRFSEKSAVLLGPAVNVLLSSQADMSGSASVSGLFPGVTLPFSNSDASTTGLNGTRMDLVLGVNHRWGSGIDLGLRYSYALGYLETDTDAYKTRQSLLRVAIGWAFLR